ncbi:MAG: ThiF family adenylyltransferase [Euryarchaeota archaeon]|jgi:molybdopterin/thiamine biosynthesis adenylyltransferase|nr:ThiF family adenylyltransferase [Euryarchaeota archaeon]
MSDRFSRQRGLIRQSVVQGLRVHLTGENTMPEPFKDAMVCLGEHLGVDTFPVTPPEASYSVSWSGQKAVDIEINPNNIAVTYDTHGIYLDGRVSASAVDPVYEPSIATIAACMVWSEILRRSQAYTPVEIPKVSVSVNVRVNENSQHTNISQLEFGLKGHLTHQNVRETNDGSAHRRVLLRLDDEDPIAIQLRDALEIRALHESQFPKFPCLEFELPSVSPRLEGHLTVVGAGGLGTWCLHTLVEGLRRSKEQHVSFLIFDKDMEVEKHNLNRQVIFTEADIGLPKIEATRRWLAQRLEGSKVDIVYELIDSMVHEVEACDDGADLDEFFDEPIDSDSEVTDVLDASEVFEHLNKTDLVLGCLDAMRPRVLADLIAAQRGLPYSNGGIANYSGEFREFSSSSLVELYGESIAQDRKVSSCQEDGEVPQSSMVLTNALVGAFQALSAIQRLSKHQTSVVKSVYWNAFENEFHLVHSDGRLNRTAQVGRLERALWPDVEVSL